MQEVALFRGRRPKCILFLGAHCDDIEIGCGGTIMNIVEQAPETKIVCITLSSEGNRADETRAATMRLLAGAKDPVVEVEAFRGSYFPYVGAALKEFIETLKTRFEPDIIFSHRRGDLHQDHRVTNELTWNTFRNHLILEYEITKYDGDIGVPNTFVPLTRDRLQKKIDILMGYFQSQLHRQWFTRDTFEAIARLRGIECNAPEGYAEGFFARKLCLDLSI